jgi:hypothetical protein
VTNVRALERYAKLVRRAREGARCEVCAVAIGDEHRHVVDCKARKLLCACSACSIAFGGPHPTRFRTVPDRVRRDPTWVVAEGQLQALGVPVGLAFFVRPSSTMKWMAIFPSPAGATEAELDEAAWKDFSAGSAIVREIADDVEALFVRRNRDGYSACFVVPVDVCYELTALLRRKWHGIDGGDEARVAIDDFIATLAKRAEVSP